MDGLTLASQPLALYRLLKARGIDADALFTAQGFDPRLFHERGARVRHELVGRLWAAAIQATGDPCLGLETWKHHHPSTIGALGYAWLASGTLKEALERVARYLRVVAGRVQAVLAEAPAGYALTLEPAALPGCIQDAFFANVLAYCRTSLGADFAPVSLALAHAAEHPERYAALFRCPVAFGAGEVRMVVDRAIALRPLATGDAEIALAAERTLENELVKLDRSDIVAQLRKRFVDALPSGSPGEEAVAQALAMSRRTLQRRLADRGTSYNGVLDETRREMAVRYLRDADLSVSEIAYLLGFGETASFNRAFRRWTGRTPSAFRAAIAAAVDTAADAALQ